jgi:prophage antirepressor-like protein
MARVKLNLVANNKTFSYADGLDIRAITRDGEPWFVALDVCQGLGIRNVSQALRRLDPDERDAIILNDAADRDNKMTVISEPGLYTILLTTRGATIAGTAAYKFRRWVTHEVLPALRKTGVYKMPGGAAELSTDAEIERGMAHMEIRNNSAAFYLIKDHIDAAWKLRYAAYPKKHKIKD